MERSLGQRLNYMFEQLNHKTFKLVHIGISSSSIVAIRYTNGCIYVHIKKDVQLYAYEDNQSILL